MLLWNIALVVFLVEVGGRSLHVALLLVEYVIALLLPSALSRSLVLLRNITVAAFLVEVGGRSLHVLMEYVLGGRSWLSRAPCPQL